MLTLRVLKINHDVFIVCRDGNHYSVDSWRSSGSRRLHAGTYSRASLPAMAAHGGLSIVLVVREELVGMYGLRGGHQGDDVTVASRRRLLPLRPCCRRPVKVRAWTSLLGSFCITSAGAPHQLSR